MYDLTQEIPNGATDIEYFEIVVWSECLSGNLEAEQEITIKAVKWTQDNSFDHEFGTETLFNDCFDFDFSELGLTADEIVKVYEMLDYDLSKVDKYEGTIDLL